MSKMKNKTILSLCGYTGNWSAPYKEDGYEVIQVDIKMGKDAILWPSDISSEPRFSREFSDISSYDIYGVIAQPVCTYFAGSGASHKRTDEQIKEGLSLVDACIRIAWAVRPHFFVMENPVGKLRRWIGPPLQIFHPWEYAGYLDNPTERERVIQREPAFGATLICQ